MTLLQFIKRNLNKHLDFDQKFGCQCVDMIRCYIRDVWNVPQPPNVDGARQLLRSSKGINLTMEGANACYEPGDVLVWDASESNIYGHTAILLSMLASNTFIVLEQDGFQQDGVKANIRTRDRLLGALWKAY